MTKGKGKMGMLRKPLTVATYNKGYGLQATVKLFAGQILLRI